MSGYRVELFGTVHVPNCPAIPGMTWVWAGRNAFNSDKACPECLSGGLPEQDRWEPTLDEIAHVRALLARLEAS